MGVFIPYSINNAQENMSIDEQILNRSIENSLEPTLRLYGWENPSLTIGRNQSIQDIDLEFCQNNNIDIVKRATGGRAVLHDKELTYSFICPVSLIQNGETVLNSYKEISSALINAFLKLGIELSYPENKRVSVKHGYCMSISTGADLAFKGKKLIGSAQFRKQNYILQHGSILLDIDKNILQKIFIDKEIKDEFITLKEIKPNFTDINSLSSIIKEAFEEKFNITFTDSVKVLK